MIDVHGADVKRNPRDDRGNDSNAGDGGDLGSVT